MRNFLVNTTDVDALGSEIAYAAYVLARNGRSVMGDLRYLADTQIASFKTPLARGQIAAALALLGDRGRSQAAFAAAVQRLRDTRDDGTYRPDYGSRLRDGAGLLALASETNASRDAVLPVSRVVEEEHSLVRRTSTQENAWMVLAAQALLNDANAITLAVDGSEQKGSFFRTYKDATLAQKPVTIANRGTAPVQVVLSVTGNPTAFEPAVSQGYTVERSYFRLDGTPANLEQVRQNERFATVLKVTDATGRDGRLLLVDRLPAGFEIDNPKLVDSGTLASLPWLKTEVTPTHAEYRDDRFVAAFDPGSPRPGIFTVAYIVRAVAPGRYIHPPAILEDMYAPERFGRTAFGAVEVAPSRP